MFPMNCSNYHVSDGMYQHFCFIWNFPTFLFHMEILNVHVSYGMPQLLCYIWSVPSFIYYMECPNISCSHVGTLPAYPCRLIRVYTVFFLVRNDQINLNGNSADPDQMAHMCWLIWIYAVRPCDTRRIYGVNGYICYSVSKKKKSEMSCWSFC
jgi:hypothetical protein